MGKGSQNWLISSWGPCPKTGPTCGSQERGVMRQAVAQQFHHTPEIMDRVYSSGLRNTLNPLQAGLYGW